MEGMKRIFVIALSIMLIMGVSAVAVYADEAPAKEPVTLSGTINDNFQIVATDGTVYEVDTNDLGNKLVEEVGKKVEVKGIVETIDDIVTITVLSYTLVE